MSGFTLASLGEGELGCYSFHHRAVSLRHFDAKKNETEHDQFSFALDILGDVLQRHCLTMENITHLCLEVSISIAKLTKGIRKSFAQKVK